jgi:SAM-dependent methyltransferase
MDRNETLLTGLEPGVSRILEVGPSFSPVAPKRDGWLTTVVDHTDRPSLFAKYGALSNLELSRIEEVDRIWAAGPLEMLLQDKLGTFDAIIASHVIEHIVDPIAFFNSASRLLNERGRIALAVPDRRLCFDCLRPVSTSGQMIAASRSKRRRHSLAAVFDHKAYHATPPNGHLGWGRGVRLEPRFSNTLETAWKVIANYDENEPGEYIDVHGWVFTPSSFECVLLELHGLGLIDWRVAELVERNEVEFLAILQKSATRLSEEAMKERRRTLLVRQLEESRQHADWMLGSKSEPAQEVAVTARTPPPDPSVATSEPDEALKNTAVIDSDGSSHLTPLLARLKRARYSGDLPRSLRGWRRLTDPKTRDIALDYRVVAGSALFDQEWYLRTYPDVEAARMDAAEHYLRFGAAEGRDPGPYFQSSKYGGGGPGVAAPGVNLLVQYLRKVSRLSF